MEILSLIGGNHLFRFSFTLGLVMIIFAVLYPMQKKNDLELEKVKYYEDLAILKIEIDDLSSQAISLSDRSKQIKRDVASPSFSKGASKDSLFNEVEKFNSALKIMGVSAKAVKLKNARVDNIHMKIETLQGQIDEFGLIAWLMKIFGLALSIFGFVFWFRGAFYGKPQLDKS